MIELGENRYGKSAIRLVKVVREGEHHLVRDLTLAIALEGDFRAAHTEGDNANVVATDTMKNTAYAFAREHLTGSIEAFGLILAGHFAAFDQVARATVTIDEHRWIRIPTAGGLADTGFMRSGDFVRTAELTVGVDGQRIEAGVRELTVMKTTRSAFSGFPRDRYTTLPETEDRLMATKVRTAWRYADPAAATDFDASFEEIMATLFDSFAGHYSRSVQESIWIIGRTILERHAEVDEVRMTMPNLHHWLVDLSPFGQQNPGEVFVATTEPHGLIEATVRRS